LWTNQIGRLLVEARGSEFSLGAVPQPTGLESLACEQTVVGFDNLTGFAIHEQGIITNANPR
jgi:hypothetical protein